MAFPKRRRATGEPVGSVLPTGQPRPNHGPRPSIVPVEAVASEEAMNRLGRAMADPTQLWIILALRDSPQTPADLMGLLSIGRRELSDNLTCLRGWGLVTAVVEQERVVYFLADARISRALKELAGLVLVTGPIGDDG